MLLHRSDELNRLDFASSLVIDHFSDGIRMGTLLRRNGVRKVIALRRPDPKPVWCALRTAGLATGLTGVEGDAVPMEEFFIGTSTPDPLFEAIRRDRGRELFFTALNDEYAAEFLLQARAQGLAAGRDYHLAAFDDNPRYRSLGISTMQVPHRRIGEIFGRMICERLVPAVPSSSLHPRRIALSPAFELPETAVRRSAAPGPLIRGGIRKKSTFPFDFSRFVLYIYNVHET